MSTISLASYKTLFLDQENLTDCTMIRDDVDMSVLTPTIRLAQDYYLYKLLGSSLYVDLQNKILAKTLNQDELLLVQAYIVPTLAWAVMKQAPIFISYKYSNKGVQTMDSTNAKAATMSELQTLGDMANEHYQLYAERLVKYLIANASLFPIYRQMTQYNDVYPATDGWDSRIALGNRPRRDNIPTEPGGSNSVNITAAMIAYFNVSKIIVATSHTSNTAIFAGSFLPAPSGLPGTSAANFTFYCNSTLIPPATVMSFVDNGNGTCTLAVDTTTLGFSFQIGDIITSSGKYQ